jgi:hypothetical protein
VYESTQSQYIWEKVGEVQTDVDLSGYVTQDVYNAAIATINSKLDDCITAEDILTTDSSKVVVDYTIPDDLYG